MADKPDMAPAADVYAPATPQLWVALLNWLGFFFQIFAQIARGTPSLTQVRSFLRFRTNSFISSPPPEFRPLPTGDLSDFPEPEEALPPLPVTVQPPTIPAGRVPACCGEELPLPRLRVVLDLDETLVCAYDKSTLPSIIKTEATKAGLKWFELECISSNKECDGRPMTSHVTVFERPGLHEFLKQLSTFADLVLFTAGLEGYARPLVDKIDLENRFILRLYRPSTISTDYREHVKDLCCISKDLSRIVIVDNNPFSFLLQPLNGIPCIPFSAGQPHDEQLLKVLLPLLKHLSHQKDVRHVLNERFHMPEWFRKQGIPCSGLTK